MPAQNAKSGLAAKYGAKLDQAVAKHAEDNTDYGQQGLPGGIRDGIAKLVECTFGIVGPGKQNAGEYYFRAAGVVVSPRSVQTPNGEVVVEGRQTSIMEMVCDTKTQKGDVTTQEQHVSNILNEMRKLGADTTGMTGADLESLAAALKESQPYFKFATRESKPTPEYPNPRVFEQWFGTQGLEDYVPPEDTETKDGSDAVPVKTPPPPAAKPAPAAKSPPPSSKSPVKTAAPAPEPEPINPETVDQGDLDSLAQRADGGDTDAAATLTEMASKAGIPDDDVTSAGSWSEIAERLKTGEGGEGAAEEAAAEEAVPEIPKKGEIWGYRAVGKDKKPAKKASDFEITHVDETKKTVNLKSLDDPKVIFKGIPFDKLEQGS